MSVPGGAKVGPPVGTPAKVYLAGEWFTALVTVYGEAQPQSHQLDKFVFTLEDTDGLVILGPHTVPLQNQVLPLDGVWKFQIPDIMEGPDTWLLKGIVYQAGWKWYEYTGKVNVDRNTAPVKITAETLKVIHEKV